MNSSTTTEKKTTKRHVQTSELAELAAAASAAAQSESVKIRALAVPVSTHVLEMDARLTQAKKDQASILAERQATHDQLEDAKKRAQLAKMALDQGTLDAIAADAVHAEHVRAQAALKFCQRAHHAASVKTAPSTSDITSKREAWVQAKSIAAAVALTVVTSKNSTGHGPAIDLARLIQTTNPNKALFGIAAHAMLQDLPKLQNLDGRTSSLKPQFDAKVKELPLDEIRQDIAKHVEMMLDLESKYWQRT